MPAKEDRYLFTILILCAVLSAFVLRSYLVIENRYKEEARIASERVENIQNILDSLQLEAKAVSVYDYALNQKLYSRNDTVVMPLASLAKVVSVPLGIKFGDEKIRISSESISAPGDDKLAPGDIWDKVELGKFALVVSSNDATLAIAENAPGLLSEMNKQVQRLGASSTVFQNVTGLDIGETPGVFGTASDMNILSNYALTNNSDLFKATTRAKLITASNNRKYEVSNTNVIVEGIPNILFSKTGYTVIAGGNLSIIFENKQNHKIGVTILGSGYETRFRDMEKIVEVLYNL